MACASPCYRICICTERLKMIQTHTRATKDWTDKWSNDTDTAWCDKGLNRQMVKWYRHSLVRQRIEPTNGQMIPTQLGIIFILGYMRKLYVVLAFMQCMSYSAWFTQYLRNVVCQCQKFVFSGWVLPALPPPKKKKKKSLPASVQTCFGEIQLGSPFYAMETCQRYPCMHRKNIGYPNIDASDVCFGIHISSVTTKANRTFGLLRWSLKINFTSVKEWIYKASSRPVMEYSCWVLGPLNYQIHHKTGPA